MNPQKAGTKERKDRECNVVEIWKNRQETFSRVTNESVQSCVKELQRRRWKRNRRRVECQKPSMIPQTDAKSPLRSYNRLIQFRRVSCSQFMDLIRILGIDHKALEKTVHNYAADVEICAMMDDELKWKKYKQKTVESQVLCAPNQKKRQNFTQHLLNMPEIINTYNQPDYLRPLKFVRPGGSLIVNPFYLEVSERPESDAKRGRCLSNSIPSV